MHKFVVMECLKHIWPKIGDLASDIETPYPTVAAWFSADRGIPAARIPDLIAAAERRGHTLTYEKLHSMTRANRSRTHAA
jgi:hypothetical protein